MDCYNGESCRRGLPRRSSLPRGSGGTGRRTSLRGWRSQERGGSNPPFRTNNLRGLCRFSPRVCVKRCVKSPSNPQQSRGAIKRSESAVVQAWIDARLEKDRSLLTPRQAASGYSSAFLRPSGHLRFANCFSTLRLALLSPYRRFAVWILDTSPSAAFACQMSPRISRRRTPSAACSCWTAPRIRHCLKKPSCLVQTLVPWVSRCLSNPRWLSPFPQGLERIHASRSLAWNPARESRTRQ